MRQGPFVAFKPLASRLIGFLWVLAAATVLITVFDVGSVLFYPEINDPNAEVDDAGLLVVAVGMLVVGLGHMVLYLVTAVMFCVWAHRANRNARALGAEGMQFTPGWTVGWFFVPIANLFKPFQAIREVYKASAPTFGPSDWQGIESPNLVSSWWAAWLASNFLGTMEMRLALRGDQNSMELSTWIGVISTAISLLATVLVIRLIREINGRQELKDRLLGT